MRRGKRQGGVSGGAKGVVGVPWRSGPGRARSGLLGVVRVQGAVKVLDGGYAGVWGRAMATRWWGEPRHLSTPSGAMAGAKV